MQKFNGFDRDMGLDLLMNPKKKGSDVVSISSRSSLDDGDKGSVRSGSLRSVRISPDVIDVADHMKFNQDGSISESGSGSYETESEGSYESEVSSVVVRKSRSGGREQRHPRQSRAAARSVTASEGGSELESIGIDSLMQEQRQSRNRLSEEDILVMKKELLYQFERLEKKGVRLPKKFTLSSSLDEMKMEYERLKRDKEIDASVKLQRRVMMACVSGVEWMNGKWDPLGAKLDGWSDSVYENIDDYDDTFEELYEKYKGKAKMAPELKLMMLLGGSAFMHHMTHSMFKNQLPGLDEILKQNPELAKNLAAATSQHMAQQQSSAGNLFGSLGSMFSGFFGGGAGGGAGGPAAALAGLFGQGQQPMGPMGQQPPPAMSRPMPQQPVKVTRKGPTNVEDLFKDYETTTNMDNDRIEMMSAITESELQDLADDSSSINGILMNIGSGRKKGNKKSSKITLDI